MVRANRGTRKAPKRVLIVEHDEDIAYLIGSILTQAGYETQSLVGPEDVVGAVRTLLPDVAVVDLLPDDEAFRILDTMRADPDTATIPVLAMTTSERLAEAAVASYNVRATLAKPFDLDELLAKVDEVLGKPPFQVAAAPAPAGEPRDLLEQGERILAVRSREALFRWVQRLRAQPPWSERKDLGMGKVLDSVPVLVEAVVAAMRYGNPQEFFARHPDADERVGEHARVRRQQGFGLEDLIREYAILRDELLGTLWSHLPEQVARREAQALAQVFNATLDKIIETTALAYLGGPGGQRSLEQRDQG
jgi:CheY-like chemotaxis protein